MGRKLRKLDIVKFEIEHFDELDLREQDLKFMSREELRKAILNFQKKGIILSALYENKPIFIGGFYLLSKSSAEVWLVCSKKIVRFVRELLFYTEKVIERFIKDNNLIRIQSIIDADWTEAENFIKRIGFQKEGVLRKYLFSHDYIIYSRVK